VKDVRERQKKIKPVLCFLENKGKNANQPRNLTPLKKTRAEQGKKGKPRSGMRGEAVRTLEIWGEKTTGRGVKERKG